MFKHTQLLTTTPQLNLQLSYPKQHTLHLYSTPVTYPASTTQAWHYQLTLVTK